MPFREVPVMDKEREFVELARRPRRRTLGSFVGVPGSAYDRIQVA